MTDQQLRELASWFAERDYPPLRESVHDLARATLQLLDERERNKDWSEFASLHGELRRLQARVAELELVLSYYQVNPTAEELSAQQRRLIELEQEREGK